MNKYIGIAVAITALLAQLQMSAGAQTSDRDDSQAQLQPPMTAMPDAQLRGPVPVTAQSSTPAPFSTTSSYSYKEQPTPMPAPVGGGYEPNSSYAIPAPMPTGAPPQGMTPVANSKATTKKLKEHGGFSPVGAVLGVPDRAAKSSLGLADRTTKTGLGVTGKTTKELFKAIF